jgi:hypothetical protein
MLNHGGYGDVVEAAIMTLVGRYGRLSGRVTMNPKRGPTREIPINRENAALDRIVKGICRGC